MKKIVQKNWNSFVIFFWLGFMVMGFLLLYTQVECPWIFDQESLSILNVVFVFQNIYAILFHIHFKFLQFELLWIFSWLGVNSFWGMFWRTFYKFGDDDHVPYTKRLCQGCDLGKVEDEKHLLLICPNTQKVRECFCSTLPLTHTSTLVELMQSTNRVTLAKFVACCQYQRTIFPPWSTFRLMDSLVPNRRKIVNSKQIQTLQTCLLQIYQWILKIFSKALAMGFI